MRTACKWCEGCNDFAQKEYCFCRCQSCGGEKDGEGNCANYCVDEPVEKMEAA